MTLRVWDFVCKNGHKTEFFVRPEVIGRACPVCSELAERVVCAPHVNLDAISGDFPGATMTWERKREQHMAQEKKVMREHGEYLNGRKVQD